MAAEAAAIAEALKIIVGGLLILQQQAGLNDQQMDELINSLREQFKEERSKPLPNV